MSNLVTSRKFAPLFVTQFFGAFNDNLFKNALVILVTFQILSHDSTKATLLVNLSLSLFTAPTLLFSYLSGPLADKVDRAYLTRLIKIIEIGLAFCGSLGLYFQNLSLLFATLFGFGLHSAFYGPIKYALLPQHLERSDLVKGNAYIEAGTFLAILSGTILGSYGLTIVIPTMMLCACLGFGASCLIPKAPAPVPALILNYNPWRGTRDLIQHSRSQKDEFICILGISWFWFVGALLVTQFPPYAKDILRADKEVVTAFLTAFSLGIAFGSVLCSRIIRGAVRATPVPFGALGMSLFALDLYRTSLAAAHVFHDGLLGLSDFLHLSIGWHVLIDLFGLAVCGGLYIVPLYALLQVRSDQKHGARAIASNNVMNAIFMVAASLVAMAFVSIGLSIPQMFLATAILNLGAAVYIVRLLPFSLLAAFLKLVYRVDVRGLENWEKAGDRVLIIGNHTAFLDAAIFAAFLPERVGFAVNTFIAERWWVKPLFKMIETFPVDPTNPMATKRLIDQLKKNKKIVIFPEGRLTMTGSLMKVYEGPGMIADKSDAMILPVRIEGAQYSPLSRLKGKVRIRWFPKVTLTFLPPQKFSLPDTVFGRRRRQLASAQLYDLMSQMIFESSPCNQTLFESLVEARRIHGGHHSIAEDQRRVPLTYRNFIGRIFYIERLLRPYFKQTSEPIGLLMPNTVAAALSFFALQAGSRTAAMLNFTASYAQIKSACCSAGVTTVLTSKNFIELAKLTDVIAHLRDDGKNILYLEDIISLGSPLSKIYAFLAGLIPELFCSFHDKDRSEKPAVILFTSGSEGLPKGVVLSHKNILSNRYQLASRIDFGPQDIVFNCLPMFHAFGLTGGTLLPLLAGIKVFFYPSPLHYRIVPELIYDSNATILFGTDTFLSGYARFANPYDFYALRYVFAGAEKLKEETRQSWFEKFGVRIFEGYGATETAPVLSVNTAMHFRAGTVGRVLPGIQTRFEDVPGITEGQRLFIKGPNVMLGYMKEDTPGVLQPLTEGEYDTGDIVSVDEDGFVRIQGRVKRFAKIAGEMVSLTAVEGAIQRLWAGVNHAVVCIPDPKKGEALVLVTEFERADLSQLPEWFRRSGLPELALPRRMISVTQIPLLGTGKTDYVRVKELALLAGQSREQKIE